MKNFRVTISVDVLAVDRDDAADQAWEAIAHTGEEIDVEITEIQ
jgi:hypothetical protein